MAHLRRFLLGGLVLLAACGFEGSPFAGIDVTGVSYGRDFQLKDPDGHERTLAGFRGRYVALFFGYVQCPEVCPTALARAAEVRRLLGADGGKLQVLFITVDPERDTGSLLRQYTGAFDPSFLGLWSDLPGTRKVAEEFRVFYRKAPGGSSYTVDHSAFTYVIDTQGRLRLVWRNDLSAEQCASDIRVLMKLQSSS